ncbi:ABC transporter ATP-binding protein [candidate division CSSED10-310 bacterium]|uniref:ABC transporter ATP-binding protein n=1 Tax=candidate division CSSED10-310 bacterium TaxID=2855610 RepID=A0ABV6Z1Z3_UNCC1
MTEPVIELKNLSVDFYRKNILNNLTGALQGQAIGLLGPNGAGKTTLIRTLLGFHKPTSGSATILGQDIMKAGKSIRHALGYMPETDTFIAGMSAVRFVRYLAELNGLPSADAMERAHEILFFVGLGEARYRNIETFSQGMIQRIKLAQALVHSPQLVFLDEPTNGLDPASRLKMIDLLKDIRQKKALYLIISSHLLRDIEETCDEVLILNKGQIAAYCNIEQERRTNRGYLDLEINGNQNGFTSALEQKGCQFTSGRRNSLKVIIPGEVTIRDIFTIAAEHDTQIRRLTSRKDSLEDIFTRAIEANNGSV